MEKIQEPFDWQERLTWIRALRPNIGDELDHVRIGRLFGHGTPTKGLPEVLAELVPEQREFWLRVGAQMEIQFVEGLTACFEARNRGELGPPSPQPERTDE